jgi:hypothetical protein
MTASPWGTPQAKAVKERIRRALLAGVIHLFEALCGPTTTKNKAQQRWRFPGAVEVDVKGAKQGRWRDWSAGPEGKGDPLAAIRWFKFNNSGEWSEVWDWASRHTGIAPPEAKRLTPEERRKWREQQRRERAEQRRQRAIEDKRRGAEEERDRNRRIALARKRWEAASTTIGAPGETYLTEVRGIPRPAAGWPSCIRWDAAKCALVFAATTAAGELEAVHTIYLTPDGANRIGTDDRGRPRKLKVTRGHILGGAVVRLPALIGGLEEPLLHAEGCETGLSAWRASGLATWIRLGAISRC